MKRICSLSYAALAPVACLLAISAVGQAQIGVDIRIGLPPPPVVVVGDYDSGFRHALYDADWRLRLAQEAQYNARNDLDAARAHEADMAIDADEQQGVVDDLVRRIQAAGVDEALRVQISQASVVLAEVQAKADELDRRAALAKADLDAVRAAGQADFDAASRFHHAQADSAAVHADVDDAAGRLAALKARAVRVDVEPLRIKLGVAQDQLAHFRGDLAAAHDAVYVCQQRLDQTTAEVCLALHDRDEALFMLHRDWFVLHRAEIVAGRIDCGEVGFVLDVEWGRHWHGDIEELHAHFVHPVDYWIVRPVEVFDRVVVVDRLPEIVKVRDVERVKEVERVKVVERFETTVKVEDRRRVAEVVKVERDRFAAEKAERDTAAKENRPAKSVYVSKPADVQVSNLRHTEAAKTNTPTDTRHGHTDPASGTETPADTRHGHTDPAPVTTPPTDTRHGHTDPSAPDTSATSRPSRRDSGASTPH